MTRRSPVPRIIPFVLLMPIVVVLGFALSWSRTTTPVHSSTHLAHAHPGAIAYSQR